jgi:hypothetical protein
VFARGIHYSLAVAFWTIVAGVLMAFALAWPTVGIGLAVTAAAACVGYWLLPFCRRARRRIGCQ